MVESQCKGTSRREWYSYETRGMHKLISLLQYRQKYYTYKSFVKHIHINYYSWEMRMPKFRK